MQKLDGKVVNAETDIAYITSRAFRKGSWAEGVDVSSLPWLEGCSGQRH